MNITYFIGNGFDSNQGLATRYSDFYPYFLEHATDDNMIKKWIKDNYIQKKEYWSDLEEDLGLALKNIHTAKELAKFYIDKDELDDLLIDYLEEEQKKFVIEDNDKIEIQFLDSIKALSLNMEDGDYNSIKATLNIYSNHSNINYNFITFNYTNTLDKVISIVKERNSNIKIPSDPRTTRIGKLNEYYHLHGTLEGGMILGVNDEQQIDNEKLQKNAMFLNSFVKTNMNGIVGNSNTVKTSDIIKESNIICIYGMSIGNTDKFWWEEIMHWLQLTAYNKLVIFHHVDERKIKRGLPSRIARMKEEVYSVLFDRGNIKDEALQERLKRQIIILANKNIFKFQ